jgi:C4-dicarboxylate-specific signal transduction histidine kinase
LIRKNVQVKKDLGVTEDPIKISERMANIFQLARLGRITGGVTHDLANNLSSIMIGLEMAKKKTREKKMIRLIRQTELSAQNMRRLLITIKEQLNGRVSCERFCVNDEITRTIKLYSFVIKRNGIKASFQPNCRAYAHGNPARFSQAIFNLLGNAIDAVEKNEKKNIYINLTCNQENLVISIKDNGCESTLPPPEITLGFSSKKKEDGHLGLGLSIVKQIVEAEFKGSLEMKTSTRNGACFIIRLPQA